MENVADLMRANVDSDHRMASSKFRIMLKKEKNTVVRKPHANLAGQKRTKKRSVSAFRIDMQL